MSSPFVLLRAQDKTIGKKVYNIHGSVPAANFIQCGGGAKARTLGLTGAYLYAEARVAALLHGSGGGACGIGGVAPLERAPAHWREGWGRCRSLAPALVPDGLPLALPSLSSSQVKLNPSKYFVLHIDVVTQDKNALRISLSNLFKLDGPRVKGSTIQARSRSRPLPSRFRLYENAARLSRGNPWALQRDAPLIAPFSFLV